MLAPTSPETDREALVALYNATGGAEWWNNQNWLSDAPMREWPVSTPTTTAVSGGLTLGERLLSGEIPPELSSLANLRELYLSGNQLSGEIPPELGNLASLEYLDLRGNRLSGCVPISLRGRSRTLELGGLRFCPATAAEATMAQTPPETDREGLVALYNATDGPTLE